MALSDKWMVTIDAHPASIEYYKPWMEIRKMDYRQIIRRGLPGLTRGLMYSTHHGLRDSEQRRWLHVVCRHWGPEHPSTLSQQWCLARTTQPDFWMKGDKSLYKPSDIPPNPSLLTTIKPTVQRQSNTSFNSNSASTSTTTMHFINAIFALVAASAVMAAPAPAPAEDASAKAQVDCPNGWSQCGVCFDIPLL